MPLRAGCEPFSIWEGLDPKSEEYRKLKEERAQVLMDAVEVRVILFVCLIFFFSLFFFHFFSLLFHCHFFFFHLFSLLSVLSFDAMEQSISVLRSIYILYCLLHVSCLSQLAPAGEGSLYSGSTGSCFLHSPSLVAVKCRSTAPPFFMAPLTAAAVFAFFFSFFSLAHPLRSAFCRCCCRRCFPTWRAD